jgi:hypothetical protein
MSARVYPHLRESRVGILPKRDEDSKRKLSELHAQAPQITHSFSTARKMRPELFYRKFLVAISRTIARAEKSLGAFADQRAGALVLSFRGPGEIENAPRVAAKKQSIRLDEDGLRNERRT